MGAVHSKVDFQKYTVNLTFRKSWRCHLWSRRAPVTCSWKLKLYLRFGPIEKNRTQMLTGFVFHKGEQASSMRKFGELIRIWIKASGCGESARIRVERFLWTRIEKYLAHCTVYFPAKVYWIQLIITAVTYKSLLYLIIRMTKTFRSRGAYFIWVSIPSFIISATDWPIDHHRH